MIDSGMVDGGCGLWILRWFGILLGRMKDEGWLGLFFESRNVTNCSRHAGGTYYYQLKLVPKTQGMRW